VRSTLELTSFDPLILIFGCGLLLEDVGACPEDTPSLSKTMKNIHVIQILDTKFEVYSVPEKKGSLC
jgi:hypothetical protein